jgi:hypothetical protein
MVIGIGQRGLDDAARAVKASAIADTRASRRCRTATPSSALLAHWFLRSKNFRFRLAPHLDSAAPACVARARGARGKRR